MSYTIAWTIVGILVAGWVLITIIAGLADAMVRRRLRELDELHEWREKVEAMRRLNLEDDR